jgi:hypothetical protein
MFPPRPSVPVPYLAGTISVPAGKAVGVLVLIHQQIDPNCPGTSVEFRISADPSNQTPVFIGQIMGDEPLSCTNYGAILTPMGEERRYRASYPGTGTPQGMMQVFSEAPAKLHVEVNT